MTTYMISPFAADGSLSCGMVAVSSSGQRSELPTVRTLVDLLHTTAGAHGGGSETSLILTADAVIALDLPVELDADSHTGAAEALGAARGHGWQVSKLAAWTTFHQRGSVVHVGHGPALFAQRERQPLLFTPNGNHRVTTVEALTRFDIWQGQTGRAWHGTPGVAGTSVLRATAAGVRTASAGSRRELMPTWSIEIPDHVVRNGLERDYTADWSPGTLEVGQFRHEYDLNMAYLAASMVVRVARGKLENLPRLGVDERRDLKLAGYFLADVDGWPDPTLPDPCGYRPRRADKSAGVARWVTGPTLDLIDELREAGLHGGYTIVDAYCSKGSTILRPWAELLRDVITWARERGDAGTIAAGKGAYRETIGLLGRPGGMIYRPDWHSAVIAQARVNLWRKLRTVGLRTGHWPSGINVDAVTYTTDEPDPDLFARRDLSIRLDPAQLGAWKHKHTDTTEGVTR